MTHHTNVKIRHDPLWNLRNLFRKQTTNLESEIHSKPIDVSLKKGASSVTAQDIRRATSLADFSLPNVVSKLRSADYSTVLQAIDELRARGHLSDGTLTGAYLRYVNMQRANLSEANLENSNLERADMEMADLSYANFNNARLTRASLQSANLDQASINGANLVGARLHEARNVSNEQLAQAGRMRGSILPDGNLYDGRFNLPGDFADACILHIDLNDPGAIASFYGVSLEDFLHGQEWRLANMPSVSAWHESDCYQNAELIMKWL